MMPAHGPTAGGTVVVLQGAHLRGVTGVAFSGLPVEAFSIDGDGQITAVAPPREASGNVLVTLSGPQGSASAWFTYSDPPLASAAVPTGQAVDPCSVAIAPTAPDERLVVPFPKACGIEAVAVRLPPASGTLSLSVTSLPALPEDLPAPGLAATPTLVFEATLRNATGADVAPGSTLLQVRVSERWLDTCPADRCRPALLHYHNATWTDHELTPLDQANGTLVMQAEVHGFSIFAVAGLPLAPQGPAILLWAWPVGAVLATAVPATALAARRRRRRATAAQADDDARVELLLKEMRDKEELLQFVNLAAHDLANPLTPIQLQLDLLADAARDRADAEQEGALAAVRTNVEQLETLVKDLRDAAKLQSGKLRIAPAPMDLGDLVAAVVRSYEPQAAAGGIAVASQVEGPLPVRADRGQVLRVLTNFVGNAIKFTPRDGRIDLHSSHDGHDAFVRVTDTGLGLTEEDRARLFRPFSQVHGETEKAKGTGLGLFICKGIVEGHGGRIGCTSEGPGKGSTFWFTIPLNQDSPGPEPAEERAGGAAEAPSPDSPAPSTGEASVVADAEGPVAPAGQAEPPALSGIDFVEATEAMAAEAAPEQASSTPREVEP